MHSVSICFAVAGDEASGPALCTHAVVEYKCIFSVFSVKGAGNRRKWHPALPFTRGDTHLKTSCLAEN